MRNGFPVSSSPRALFSLCKEQLAEAGGGVLAPAFGHLQSPHAGNLVGVERPRQLSDTPHLSGRQCDVHQLAQSEPHFPVRRKGGPAARKRVRTGFCTPWWIQGGWAVPCRRDHVHHGMRGRPVSSAARMRSAISSETHPLRARLELRERRHGSVPQPQGYPQAGRVGCVAEESTPHGFPQRFRA